jgi:3-phenylpropionate/trans-cinnamate dioxygenase ferredoxin subunit
MPNWITVANKDEIPDGGHKVVEVDGRQVAVFNVKGEFLAIEDVCTHDGAELADDGMLEGDAIICPRHGAKFCLRTGAVLEPPAYEPVRSYRVRVEGDDIRIAGG